MPGTPTSKSGARPVETRRIDLGFVSKRTRASFPGNSISTTKYKLWNIIPANLFEQFHRAANVWFLVVSIFQMLPLDISPTNRYATLVPLCCVLVLTFCKDAIEDYRRWKDDHRINNQTCQVYDRALMTFRAVRWCELTVGMYIRLTRDDPVPADFMVLGSSTMDGLVFVDTAQLDGETSLKPKHAPEGTTHLIQTVDLNLIEGHVEAEQPNEFVQSFTGMLYLQGVPRGTPLDLKSVILRGSTIRNTTWVLGLVIYTGSDTKVVRNSNLSVTAKRSQVEVTANKLLIIVFFLLSAISMILALVRATAGFTGSGFRARRLQWVWPEFDEVKDNPWLSVLTFMIGYNNLIPISLYVTTDIVRAAQAFLMQKDSSMYHKDTNTHCIVRSSGLCEDLGQVEFVMTDKTGTLTQNLMCYKACHVSGQTYGYWDPGPNDARSKRGGGGDAETSSGAPCEAVMCIPNESVCMPLHPKLWHANRAPKRGDSWSSLQPVSVEDCTINQFFLCLAICHTATTESVSASPTQRRPNSAGAKMDGQMDAYGDPCMKRMSEVEKAERVKLIVEANNTCFKSPSPDEEALLAMARDYGFFFRFRSGNKIHLNIRGEEQVFSVVMINDFTSDRKRMSILVQKVTNDNGATSSNLTNQNDCAGERDTHVPKKDDQTFGHLPDFGGQYILFAKGADNVMLERLRCSHQDGLSEDSNSLAGSDFDESFCSAAPQNEDLLVPQQRAVSVNLRPHADRVAERLRVPSQSPSPSGEAIAIAPPSPLSLTPAPPSDPANLHASPFSNNMQSVIDGADCHPNQPKDASKPLKPVVNVRIQTEQSLGARCRTPGVESDDDAMHTLKKFAAHGLRTLCCAQRELSDDEAKQFVMQMREARGSFMNREKMEQEVLDDLETDFELLGVTAVEDKIQDGVPETVSMLLQGGMKVWMLTGDSMETAINTAVQCRLGDSSCTQFILDADNQSAELILNILEDMYFTIEAMLQENPSAKWCLAVHGQALYTILEEDAVLQRQLFILIACSARYVVACRLAPAQKAALVELVRTSLEGHPLILAIGDGGNDVSMIQKANVGVGILGVEGREAANSADFAIGQFRFLRSLLFVHGRWNLRRISIVIGYSFYKNFVHVVPMVCYSYFAGFTGTTLYDSYLLMMYNLVFTNVPIFIVGVLDIDVYASSALNVPALYQLGIGRKYFNSTVLLGWLARGIIHALFNFMLTFFVIGGFADGGFQGSLTDYLAFGSWSYWSCVMVANMTLFQNSQVAMDWQLCVILASVFVFPPLLLLYSHPKVALVFNPGMVGVAEHMLGCLPGWLALGLVLALSALGDVAANAWRRFHSPDLVSRIQDFEGMAHLRLNLQLGRSGSKVADLASSASSESCILPLDEKQSDTTLRGWDTMVVDVGPTPKRPMPGSHHGDGPVAMQLMKAYLRNIPAPKRQPLQFGKGGQYPPFQTAMQTQEQLKQGRTGPIMGHRRSNAPASTTWSDKIRRRCRDYLHRIWDWQWQEVHGMPEVNDVIPKASDIVQGLSSKTGQKGQKLGAPSGTPAGAGTRQVLSSRSFAQGDKAPVKKINTAKSSRAPDPSASAVSQSGKSVTALKGSDFLHSVATLQFLSVQHEHGFRQKFGDEAAVHFRWAIRILALIVSGFQAARLFAFAQMGEWDNNVIFSITILFGVPLGCEILALPLWLRIIKHPEDYITAVTIVGLISFHVSMFFFLQSPSGVICGTYLLLVVAAGVRIRFPRMNLVLWFHNIILLIRPAQFFQEENCKSDDIGMIGKCGFPTESLVVQQFAVTILVICYAYMSERFARQSYALDAASQSIGQQDMKLLRGMFPEEVVNHVMKNFGQKQPEHEGSVETVPKLPRKQISQDQGVCTVFFCDICDFEQLVERLQPTELVQLLDRAFMMFDRICESNNVTKIETVSKTFMAAGMSSSDALKHDDDSVAADAMNTLLSAVHIIRKVVKSALGIEKVPRIQVKIGLHTGPVISGVVGSQKPQFALFGDTVNTAARMCSTGKVGHVHVSESTYGHVSMDKRFSWENRQTEVKGKGAMNTYLLINKFKSKDLHNYGRRQSNPMLAITPSSSGFMVDGSPMSIAPGSSSGKGTGSMGIVQPHSEKRLQLPTVQSRADGSKTLSDRQGPAVPPASGVEVPAAEVLPPRASQKWIDISAEVMYKGFNWCIAVAKQDMARVDKVSLLFVTLWSFWVCHTLESLFIIFSAQGLAAKRRGILIAVRGGYSVVFLLVAGLSIDFGRVLRCLRSRRRRTGSGALSLSAVVPDDTPLDRHDSSLAVAEMVEAVTMAKSRKMRDGTGTMAISREGNESGMLGGQFAKNETKSTSCCPGNRFSACVLLVLAGHISAVASSVYGLMNSSYEEINHLVYFESLFFNTIMLHLCMLRVSAASVSASVLMLIVCVGLGGSTMDDWSPYALYPLAQYLVQVCLIYGMKAYHLRSHSALEMIQHETQMIDQILNSLLPKEVLMEMKTDCLSVAYSYHDMTLLFADIVGFTKYCAQHSAAEAVNLVTHLFAEFDDVSKLLGVYKVCTIGDAYVAVNEPKAVHADKVIGCYSVMGLAQAMLSIILAVRSQVQHAGLDMRIGLHHGSFVAGVIGTNRLRFDIWGEDVLIGNNIESSGLPGKICVSQQVKVVLSSFSDFNFSFHQDVVLKSGRCVKSYVCEKTTS
ncbi:unnamed protein product [Polarella glacialis]|uniref:P-type phospholipid transporter n=1 Tax=Polarella glacialis TaxID=89957 RepID=A0A813LGF9_POLGL|nr:unnamed protein product [Polarella glacialis]